MNAALSPLRLDAASLAACGDRASMQDMLAVSEQPDAACYVLCDGVGGQAGGGVAARVAADAAVSAFRNRDGGVDARTALSCMAGAREAVVAASVDGAGGLRNMATTIAILLVDRAGRSAFWAHLGDTRLYLFRQGRVARVTRDHSVAQQLVDAGCCDARDIAHHPQRNRLYAAIGAAGDEFEVPVDFTAVSEGDAFLLCTDGFWESLPGRGMEAALARAHDARTWLEGMKARIDEARAAHAAAAQDNHTALAILAGREAGSARTA